MSVGSPFSTEQTICSHRTKFLSESPLEKALRCWITLEWRLSLGELSICTEDTLSAPYLSFLWLSFVLWWEEVTPEVIVSALDSLATCEMLLKAVQEQELLFAVWDPHPLWELWGSVQLRGMLQAWFAKLSLKPSCREGNWPPIQGGWSLCGEMWLWIVEGRADFHTTCGEHTASGHRFHSHP